MAYDDQGIDTMHESPDHKEGTHRKPCVVHEANHVTGALMRCPMNKISILRHDSKDNGVISSKILYYKQITRTRDSYGPKDYDPRKLTRNSGLQDRSQYFSLENMSICHSNERLDNQHKRKKEKNIENFFFETAWANSFMDVRMS